MTNAVPDLTPPGKNSKPPKTTNGAEKTAKPPKAEKPAKDPNAPKTPRAPRTDYGYRPDAVIGLSGKDASKFRGARKDWFTKISAFSGKKVSEFLEANKGNEKDPPRGWVRFFAQEGFVTLTGGTEPKKEEAPKPSA